MAAIAEKLYTIPELADLLRIDRHHVTDLFKDERGVIVLGDPITRRGNRKYRQYRVPQSAVNRVLARITNK